MEGGININYHIRIEKTEVIIFGRAYNYNELKLSHLQELLEGQGLGDKSHREQGTGGVAFS